MKAGLLTLILLAVSCGEHKVSQQDRVGELRQITSSAVTGNERADIEAVCNALSQAQSTLSSSLNSRHTFNALQTDCSGNTIQNGDVQVMIQTSLSGFVFKRVADGLDFIFPIIETPDVGVLSGICRSLPELTSPIVNGNDITFFTTTGISQADCRREAGEICVSVEKAFPQNENSAAVHTKEWLKVRINSVDARYIGFVTDRKKVTRSFCGRDEVLTFRATLK